MSKLIYLASPYNDDDAELRQWRYDEACRATAWLMNRGEIVYSPIVHNHPLAEKYDLPKGWDYWQAADTEILYRCDVMYVLQLPGWNESQGIAAELAAAKEQTIPVGLMWFDGKDYRLSKEPK